jgi:hypothetical protein
MRSTEADAELAKALVLEHAARTGVLSPEAHPPRRYLWTDAFAVCNLLGLARTSGELRSRSRSHWMDLALRLVDQVHGILGRHRTGGARAGWLSGLGEAEGAAHPTAGGLRIGKKLAERRPDEPLDARLEWDRDGQYFHYLTKWMHALDQVARATRQPRFNLWARELAAAAHDAFSYGPPGARRMVWKMASDLSRPLVPSMGQHDALDGLVTCVQLQRTAAELGHASDGPSLIGATADFAAMVQGHDLSTMDPLGLGGLLTDAWRIAQAMRHGPFADGELLDTLLATAREGLAYYAGEGELREPASRRLAFRELGLAIGLTAIELLGKETPNTALGARLAALQPHLALAPAIRAFWVDPENRKSPTWSDHRDINDVMLATSLAPDGFLLAPSLTG